MTADTVPVEQVDRDAAAAHYVLDADLYFPNVAREIQSGDRDHDPLVRSFARHRASDDGWRTIESAPHNKSVLLAHQDWRDGKWIMAVGPASTGERNAVGSSISHHGSATHWRPLPTPPATGAGA